MCEEEMSVREASSGPPSADTDDGGSFMTNPAREVDPASLFAADHISHWTPQLVAYAPLGCIVAALRCMLWVAGIGLDAPLFRHPAVVSAYLTLLGVRLVWRGEHHIPRGRHVLVSNHVSVGDLLVLFQRPQRVLHLITPALPPRIMRTRHLPVLLAPASKDTYQRLAGGVHRMRRRASGSSGSCTAQQERWALAGSSLPGGATVSCSAADGEGTGQSVADETGRDASSGMEPQAWHEAPLHVFPEGAMTNGSGMMRFSRGFLHFAALLPVVPVALRRRTALPEVSSHTLTSSFIANLFWCSFPLWTELEATVLPPMVMAKGESKGAFAQRVQAAIAHELGCGVADLSMQQKHRMVQGALVKQRAAIRQ